MLDSATRPANRVTAADSILDHTTKAIEIEDIEARDGTRSCGRERTAPAVKIIDRRLRKLEDRFGPAAEGLNAKETERFLREYGAE